MKYSKLCLLHLEIKLNAPSEISKTRVSIKTEKLDTRTIQAIRFT